MAVRQPYVKPYEQEDVELLEEISSGYNLVLWNDDVNTFDWVIQSLIEVCGHSEQQAEQCAMIIHFNGKYAVKRGDFETLRPRAKP